MTVEIVNVDTGATLTISEEYFIEFSIERVMEDISLPGEEPNLIAIGGTRKRLTIRYALVATDATDFENKIKELESIFGTADVFENFQIKITEWWGNTYRDCLIPLVSVSQRGGEPLKADVEIRVMLGKVIS